MIASFFQSLEDHHVEYVLISGQATVLARRMETDWGPLAVVGLKDLVELKKTQRLEDYPIVSNLALAWFTQPECRGAPDDLDWALENIFTLSALRLFHAAHPQALEQVAAPVPGKVDLLLRQLASGADPSEALENEVSALLQEKIAVLQQADRRHWRPIIAELRQLRALGRLMPEGGAV